MYFINLLNSYINVEFKISLEILNECKRKSIVFWKKYFNYFIKKMCLNVGI